MVLVAMFESEMPSFAMIEISRGVVFGVELVFS